MCAYKYSVHKYVSGSKHMYTKLYTAIILPNYICIIMKYLALCSGLCTALPECRFSVGWSVCVTNVERGMYRGHTVPDVIHWSAPTYLPTYLHDFVTCAVTPVDQ